MYAHCTDAASVYHGLAKLELSLGNMEAARSVLRRGMKEVQLHDGMMDSNQQKRAVILARYVRLSWVRMIRRGSCLGSR